MTTDEFLAKVESLVNGGMTIQDAEKSLGVYSGRYHYYLLKKKKLTKPKPQHLSKQVLAVDVPIVAAPVSKKLAMFIGSPQELAAILKGL